MARRFLNKKTQRFYFLDESGDRKSYVLIFGDEVNTVSGTAPSDSGWVRIEYRGRTGEMKSPPLMTERPLEMYFLDVGQGDAAFIVTPNNTKILVDGGLRDRALGFLIWKYRLDQPGNSIAIDCLVLSHADEDHVQGLVPVLDHPGIQVDNILHSGIAVFESGFNSELGNVNAAGQLTTRHNSVSDLAGLSLHDDFDEWIQAVRGSGAYYQAVDSSWEDVDIGDPRITLEVLGPILEPDGSSFEWFGSKSHTINGHSVVFRLGYGDVRVLFTGDVNADGSRRLLDDPVIATKLDAHVFKSPHHGSHDYHQPFFNAVRPMLTVVSSGDNPDHGHPRAQFLGGDRAGGSHGEALGVLHGDCGDLR